MADTRPFKCGNCGNWYAPVPLQDPSHVCLLCLEGKHAPHNRTGLIDCHIVPGYRHESATHSEIKMTEALWAVQASVREGQNALVAIKKASGRDGVEAALKRAERAFADAEKEHRQMSEYLRWAGVLEMPGTKSMANERRFKDLGVIESLVKDNRRPPEDRATLSRSIRNCDDISKDIGDAMVEARMVIGQARQAAMAWAQAENVVSEPAATERPVVTCGCGGTYKQGGRTFHERTNIHKDWQAKRVPVGAA